MELKEHIKRTLFSGLGYSPKEMDMVYNAIGVIAETIIREIGEGDQDLLEFDVTAASSPTNEKVPTGYICMYAELLKSVYSEILKDDLDSLDIFLGIDRITGEICKVDCPDTSGSKDSIMKIGTYCYTKGKFPLGGLNTVEILFVDGGYIMQVAAEPVYTNLA